MRTDPSRSIPLPDAGFERFAFAHHSTASRRLSGRGPRLEVLWRRLEPGVHLAERLWADDRAPSVAFGLFERLQDRDLPGNPLVIYVRRNREAAW